MVTIVDGTYHLFSVGYTFLLSVGFELCNMSVFFCFYFSCCFFFFFFFSSRRRHTRWNCDWSSDVCSSDLRDSQARFNAGPRWSSWWWTGSPLTRMGSAPTRARCRRDAPEAKRSSRKAPRSEEHTSELQSQFHLVCRLLLEKKKKKENKKRKRRGKTRRDGRREVNNAVASSRARRRVGKHSWRRREWDVTERTQRYRYGESE